MHSNLIKYLFANVSKRRVPQIVRSSSKFGNIRLQPACYLYTFRILVIL